MRCTRLRGSANRRDYPRRSNAEGLPNSQSKPPVGTLDRSWLCYAILRNGKKRVRRPVFGKDLAHLSRGWRWSSVRSAGGCCCAPSLTSGPRAAQRRVDWKSSVPALVTRKLSAPCSGTFAGNKIRSRRPPPNRAQYRQGMGQLSEVRYAKFPRATNPLTLVHAKIHYYKWLGLR